MNETDFKIRMAIRERMLRESITQTELAERLGVTQQSLSDIIRGKRAAIPSSLLKLLEALGLQLVATAKEPVAR